MTSLPPANNLKTSNDMTKLELNELEMLILIMNRKINYELGVGNPYESLYKTIRDKLVKMYDETYEDYITQGGTI